MDFLSEGVPTPITLRVPRNLKEAATETARLRGVSFSAFVRSCIINELSEGE
jgi:predicted HicB family RNase H-like nuclease